jgi:hypothetical protein
VLCAHGTTSTRGPTIGGTGVSADPTPAGEQRKASDRQRREFHEALLEAARFEDLPGKWQAAILKAEQNGPKPRVVTGE